MINSRHFKGFISFVTISRRLLTCPLTKRLINTRRIYIYIYIFFFLINNVRILLIIKRLPSRVHWGCTMGHKSRNKRTTVKKNRKGRTRKMRKNHTPFKERVREKRLNL